MIKRVTVFSLCFVSGVLSYSSVAAEKDVISMMSVQQRLERVERLVGSELLMQQAQKIDLLQEEIAALREQLDQQGYELNTLKQRQRSLYVDMDRRIHDIETAVPGQGASNQFPASGLSAATPVDAAMNAAATGIGAGNTGVVASESEVNGKQDYDQAFALLKEGRYKQSIIAFEGFLKKYPSSQYADNAQYWLGEANYANREYKQALSEFQRLIARHPDSSKAPGARLKIAYVYYELENWSAARDSLQQIIKLFPDSSVARKASERLERIKREGH